MVKADVDHRFDSQDEVTVMLKQWFPNEEVKSFRKLRGGYSGTNYHIIDQEDRSFVIKICHGYSEEEVDTQVQLAAYLDEHGYDKCCKPYPVSATIIGKTRFVTHTHDGEPMILISYLPGRAGDYLIENHLLSHEDAMSQIGYHLAEMHAVPLLHPTCDHLRNYVDDGICFLGRHLKNEYYQVFTTHTEDYIKDHSFVKFYLQRYDAFIACLQSCGNMRLSVVHGDPFLDNVLFTDKAPIEL